MTRYFGAVRRKQYWQVHGMESVIYMGEEFEIIYAISFSELIFGQLNIHLTLQITCCTPEINTTL